MLEICDWAEGLTLCRRHDLPPTVTVVASLVDTCTCSVLVGSLENGVDVFSPKCSKEVTRRSSVKGVIVVVLVSAGDTSARR